MRVGKGGGEGDGRKGEGLVMGVGLQNMDCIFSIKIRQEVGVGWERQGCFGNLKYISQMKIFNVYLSKPLKLKNLDLTVESELVHGEPVLKLAHHR